MSRKTSLKTSSSRISIRALDRDEFSGFFAKHAEAILLKNKLYYQMSTLLNSRERNKTMSIAARDHGTDHIYLGLFTGRRFIGWTCGFRTTRDGFYISNSAIKARYRGRGLHSALLAHLLKTLKTQGYKTITCHQYTTQSKLIARKLEMGFHIVAFELNDTHGALIKMNYLINERTLNMTLRRIGFGEVPSRTGRRG